MYDIMSVDPIEHALMSENAKHGFTTDTPPEGAIYSGSLLCTEAHRH